MLHKLFNKQEYAPFDEPAAEPADTASPVGPKVAELVPLRSAPGSSIRYNPDLVDHFRQHHAWLRDALASVQAHVESGEFADAQQALLGFRRMLTTHLLEENIKMYTYVSRCLDHDPDTKASLLATKSHMDPAGTAAMRFANTYAKAGLTPFNKQAFLAEFEQVRAALIERMDWEDASLHTMYLPPDAYE